MKDNSMKISKYIEFTKPTYIYLKLTPTTSIRNYNTEQILKLVASLYRNISQKIKRVNNKFFFECTAKASYYIYLEKGLVQFYFIVPEAQFTLFKDKLIDAWNNKITITIVSDIPTFKHDCTKYFMTYKKEDAMSLTTDKRNNDLLSSTLNTLHVMQDGDRAGIFYNFIPTFQGGWKAKYDKTIEKLVNDMPIHKNKLGLGYLFILALETIVKGMEMVLDSVNLGGKTVKTKSDVVLIEDTKKKREAVVVDTQIVCFSESNNKVREYNTAISLCQSFECLNGDNELVYRRLINKNIDLLEKKINGVEEITLQAKEGQNFISLPGYELLEEHKAIEQLEVLETQVPEESQKGVLCIGENTYKDNIIKAYLPTDKNLRNLALVIIGPTRAGKSTLISNLANDARNNGECTIIFDFCGNCELSDDVSYACRNILSIDCKDLNNLQGLGYNEINQTEIDTLKQYENAKIQTSQLLTLVDSVNSSDRDLKAKMNNFLTASSLVVFVSNGSINDAFTVLRDHKLRHRYIDKIPSNLKAYLEEYVMTLKEIDEIKNGELIGTKWNTAIGGIMDRLGALKMNTRMELMLKKDCRNNINLCDEIQKNQIICLRMPEDIFSTEAEKDAYCTYWMTKIWLAVKMRKANIPMDKHVKLNVIIDELSQVPKCEEFVRSKLSQMAKFNCKMIISCHYLSQIKVLREELKSANTSYMLVSGCNKDNYKELKEELAPFTVDDLLRLKRFHSINLIKFMDGYRVFITKLPKPIKNPTT